MLTNTHAHTRPYKNRLAVVMDDQQEDPEGTYDVQHQYMCSECHQLFNTLEEVLMHQQIHTGQEGEEGEAGEAMAIQGISEYGDSQYQCLECGALLRNPDELLLHQELHMREAGLETEDHGERGRMEGMVEDRKGWICVLKRRGSERWWFVSRMKGRGCLNVEGLDSETHLLNVVFPRTV